MLGKDKRQKPVGLNLAPKSNPRFPFGPWTQSDHCSSPAVDYACDKQNIAPNRRGQRRAYRWEKRSAKDFVAPRLLGPLWTSTAQNPRGTSLCLTCQRYLKLRNITRDSVVGPKLFQTLSHQSLDLTQRSHLWVHHEMSKCTTSLLLRSQLSRRGLPTPRSPSSSLLPVPMLPKILAEPCR